MIAYGDRELLERAAAEGKIPVTIDTDFGELVAERRIALMAEVIERHRHALEMQAVITIRSGRIRGSGTGEGPRQWASTPA